MADAEEDVQYDNAAFGYFMVTGLFLYIVPSAIYTLVRLVGALRGGSDDGDVRSTWRHRWPYCAAVVNGV